MLGYDGHHAAHDLAKLRRHGPHPATQELIDTIRAQGVSDAVLLDIGAGVGTVHLALLEAGAYASPTRQVSRDMLKAAFAEAGSPT